MTLRKLSADVFVRRIKNVLTEQDKRFAFFLGAGCSISSGIPGAGSLVRDVWLPKLRDVMAPDRSDLQGWAAEVFPGYDGDIPARVYGDVIDALFLHPEERQREIERLCESRFPGFGYAVLARMMEIEGGKFNVALTTNFDDLVADALYLYTSTRPLIIHHESLASYIRPTRTRPLVVKLHGDHRLSPQNTSEETERLKEGISRQVRNILHDRGLIIMGYAGNDVGIEKMLRTLPAEALPLGIYWVSGSEPDCALSEWLQSRAAVWVEHADFDQLMLLFRDTFDLRHPDEKRFDTVFRSYRDTYRRLSGSVTALPETAPASAALKEAVQRTDITFPEADSVYLAASRYELTDPDQAEMIYRAGVEQHSTSAELLGAYAVFLETVRKDTERAEEYYRRALQTDPQHAINLGNYALFLQKVSKDADRAEEYYRRALEAKPQHANNLSNYALFLHVVRNDSERAEEYFRRALEADPQHANNLSNYALFLHVVRNDSDRAEEYFRRALEADPHDARSLGNYAWFLQTVRQDADRAEEYYERAVKADPKHAHNLGNYALFLENVRKDADRAEEYYRQAVEADPQNAMNLGSYAVFLQRVRKDADRAEEFCRRALEADPRHAVNMGNYALFLQNVRNDADGAEEYYRQAVEADPQHATNLGNYAVFLKNVRKDADRAEEFYQRALEADPQNAVNLGNYALFLQNVRKDADRAEEYYRQAVEADPQNATNLGNYAVFLQNVRKDTDRAEKYYRHALEADPQQAINLGNYAGLLLENGRDDEGMPLVEQAWELTSDDTLRAELLFYRLAHGGEKAAQHLAELKALVATGVRSPGWSLQLHVRRARRMDSEWVRHLEDLAAVITEDAPLSLLDDWSEWQAA